MPERNRIGASFTAFLRLPAILLAVVLLLAALPGCASGTATPSTAATTPSGTMEPPQAPVSGTLRLWTTPFSTVPNPLTDKDRTHRSLFRLVYQGLFRLSEEQAAVGDLCRDWTLSEDGLSLTVRLLADVRFHDGSSMDSSDVLASFEAVKAAGDRSPYAYGLSNFSAATILDEGTLRFDLVRPDAFAPHALAFPILPSEYAVNAPPSGFIPGTGPYAFVSDFGGSEVLLAKSDRFTGPGTYLIRAIKAVAIPDIRGAVEAMEDDRIDLIDLNAGEYGIYRYRQDLSITHYSGSDFLFFAINPEGGRLLGSTDAFLMVRRILDRVRVSVAAGDWAVTPSAIPAIPWSQQLGGKDGETATAAAPSPDYTWPEGQAISLLFPKEDPVRASIAGRTVDMLAASGILAVAVGADAATYSARLASKAYDVAICAATLSEIPDPGWLYLDDSVRTIPGMQSLPSPVVFSEEYTGAADALRTLLSTRTSIVDWSLVQQALSACAGYGPRVGIGFIEEGLIAGKRIKGQFSSQSNNPYNGISEVWVWSGS